MKLRRRARPVLTLEDRLEDMKLARQGRTPKQQLELIATRRGKSAKETAKLQKARKAQP